FEVGNVDEIAMGAAKMQESGWQPGWGLGRHVIGSNFFYYIRDPWGSFAEYFHDLDYIPEQCAWEPRDFPEADALYRWGPPVPEAIQPAFKGVDAVVHLAASVGMSAPFDEILRANVVGTYNVLEASRRAGVRRVVYASSGATVSGYERDMPYRALAEGRYDAA